MQHHWIVLEKIDGIEMTVKTNGLCLRDQFI